MSKNNRSILSAMTAVLCAGALFMGFAQMRNITTQELVEDMGLGINLGNTFEATGSWINSNGGVNAYETAWGSPAITEAMIKGYADAGFKTVRIPVAWSNLMTNHQRGGNYTISVALLDRVAQVVNWVIGSDMYAIVNIHWDGAWWDGKWDERNNSDGNWSWWRMFDTDSTEAMRKYTRIWEQISEKFKDHSDYLVFASMNEEGIWQDVWNQYNNSGNKTRAYGLLNAINQQFVNVVRNSGGNNANRHLQIQGYATNIDRTIDAVFKMPVDTRTPARLAVSVHYYDPFGFTHLEKDEPWAEYRATWGTYTDYDHLNRELDKMKTDFVDKGIPVIIGEYGFASKLDEGRGRTLQQVYNYTLEVTRAIYERNMLPVLWDVQLNAANGEVIYYYDRHSSRFPDQTLVNGLKAIGSNRPTSINSNGTASKAAPTLSKITLRGKTLNVSSRTNTGFQVRLVDVKGKTRAKFKANGNGLFSLDKIPAGRYLVEVKGSGVKSTSAIVLK
ncbi:MAG: cellulase family glycosylhydrolase [Chitinispirillales bacterium]|jgi:endoglucanase|nr:cellulase family glycosylhydrolase [Chitinispirillales bacterium]